MESINTLRQYNENHYIDMSDVAQKICRESNIYMDDEVKICRESNIYMDDEVKEDLENALYFIDAMARNKYNRDYWRTLYNVLIAISECE